MEYLSEALEHYEGWNRPSILNNTIAYELKPTVSIVEFIRRKNFKNIIDCGCGANDLKQIFKDRVISFDIRDIPGASLKGTFQEVEKKIKKKSADFIVCAGSLSFGSRDYIEDCVRIVSEWCQPGCIVLMITQTNFMHKAKKNDKQYKWTITDIHEWGDKYGLNIRTPVLPVEKFGTGEIERPYDHKKSTIRFQWLWQKI